MKTTSNLFNFVDMLRVSNDEINKISAQDFTLDELIEFENFLHLLGKYYQVDNIEQMHRDFCYHANAFSNKCNIASIMEIETVDWLDEDFFGLKIMVEDMAASLVLYSGKPFFSEVRR